MKSKRILYIEDDETLAYIISKKIEYLGHKVSICKDGKEAIDKLSTFLDYDLIISDNVLPCLSGIEILKHLREILNSEIPFILVSFDNSLYIKETFYKHKGTNFLKKPFEFNSLMDAIHNTN
jgi:CheY-like chemotaxis protein